MPSRLDPVPLEPVGEGGGVTEAEQFGGSGLVSSGGVQGTPQVVSRNSIDEGIEINALLYVLAKDRVLLAGRSGVRPGGYEQGVAGVLGVYGLPGGPDGGTAERIEHLADIAGPGVIDQKLSCGD